MKRIIFLPLLFLPGCFILSVQEHHYGDSKSGDNKSALDPLSYADSKLVFRTTSKSAVPDPKGKDCIAVAGTIENKGMRPISYLKFSVILLEKGEQIAEKTEVLTRDAKEGPHWVLTPKFKTPFTANLSQVPAGTDPRKVKVMYVVLEAKFGHDEAGVLKASTRPDES